MSSGQIEQFRGFAAARGYELPQHIEPGKFVRFGTSSKRGDVAGYAKLFPDLEGGIIGDFRTGREEVWQAKRERQFTPEEKRQWAARIDTEKIKAEAERAQSAANAAERAQQIWNSAKPADDSHVYLTRKAVKAHELRVYRGPLALRQMPLNGCLVVPARGTDGQIYTLQFIHPEPRDGDNKRFLAGGEYGGRHFVIGTTNGAASLCIAEGFATGATIHEATGFPVAVAFNAGNLGPVALALREKFPDLALILCADDDYRTEGNPGLSKATQAAQAVGASLATPDFGTNRPEGATDFNDMAAQCGAEAVKQAIASASAPVLAECQPDARNAPADDPASRIVVVSLLDFVNREIRPRERILAPWLLTQSLNMLYAWRGVGKTHVALGIAYATASGGSFLKWKSLKPRRVLFLDGEMPAASMQERLKGLVAGSDDDFDPEFFRLVTPDLQTGAMPDLATTYGQAEIDAIIGDAELIVIDNLSSLARSGGRENDAESWLPIQPWALRQRQQGRSVLFVHHSGKGGAQRGTSKKEDILDTVLNLKRPADYNPADGAVFEVHFEKTRDMHGDDAQPFEARLQTDDQGKSTWSFTSVEDSTFDRVVTLANQGLSQKDIAEELDINKSNVSRHIRKATDAGLIQKGAIHAYS